MNQERLEQVREIYGEQAYEERKRAWERARQPPVSSRSPTRSGPPGSGSRRCGPERDLGVSY